MNQLHTKSALAIRNLFVQGEISAVEIVSHYLERIHKYNPDLQAFLKIYDDQALKKAALLDEKRAQKKPLGQMAGLPIGIKDNTHIQGEITTCGSKFLEHYRAPFSATAVRLMLEEDAIIMGKLNLDEFSMGASSENSAYMTTKNPWNTECTPGGSSGGSAAAISARLIALATGSDTGGSIRQPASFCGISGFKPTYGRVSRYGLVAFGSSLDQIGPLGARVKDIALMMETIGRNCPKDPTSLKKSSEEILTSFSTDMKGKVIGVPHKLLEDLKGEVKTDFQDSLKRMESLGATLVDVDLDILRYSIAVYYILATAEASTNLARFDGIRHGIRTPQAASFEEVYKYSRDSGFGQEVKKRILLGTFVLSSGHRDEFYRKAQKIRYLIAEAFHNAFNKTDFIAMPTCPVTAFALGSFPDPFEMYLQDSLTIPASLAGLPAISVPSGIDSKNKPMSLQIIGPKLQDAAVLQAGYAFEQTAPLYKTLPKGFL